MLLDKGQLGERIASARKAKGFSQDYVASQLNMIRQTYGAYERGISIPDALTLSALANLFEVSADYLLAREVKVESNREKSMREILDEDPITAGINTLAANGAEKAAFSEDQKRELQRIVHDAILQYDKEHKVK